MLTAAMLSPAHAAGFGDLYSFAGSNDGAAPQANLIHDAAGNLYGTTQSGGANNAGTVFKLTSNGDESILHSFGGSGDGQNPLAGLVINSSGDLFGTTQLGGAAGQGTVFQVAADGTETVFYSFTGGKDGGKPAGSLLNHAGLFYGTAASGGAGGAGVVFRVGHLGREKVVHAFAGGADGAEPLAGMIFDKAHNMYGTTYLGGGSNAGTVFEIAADGTESVLHAFGGAGDGANPAGVLMMDSSGNLYGTTTLGGTSNAGTIFKLAPDGTETVLWSFTGGLDGGNPACSLVRNLSGELFGAAPAGGANGHGNAFRLATNGTMVVLHSFSGPDGNSPQAGLTVDRKGLLVGTAPEGGADGYGVVYRIKE